MIKYFLFIVTWLLLSNGVRSQDQGIIDSLQWVLKSKTGGERFAALYELTFQYVVKDNIRALTLIEEAEEAAMISGDSLWIVKSKRVKAHLLYLSGEISDSEKILLEILPVTLRNNFTLETVLAGSLLGKLLLFTSRYDGALGLFFRNLELSENGGDTVNIAIALHDIAMVYYKLTDYEKALEYYYRAFKHYQYFNGNDFLVLANIGLCYANLNDFAKARTFVEKSLLDCGSECDDHYRVNIEYAFGLIALGERNFPVAEEHFLKSYSLARKLGSARFQLDNVYLLAEVFIKKKLFTKAKDLLTQTERIINDDTPFNLEIIKVYSRFSELYLAIQDYEKASFYQNKYIQLKDSIYNEEMTTSLMKIEAAFLERENEAKIEEQEQVISLKEEIILRQQKLNIAISLLALAVLLLFCFVLRHYMLKRSLNLLLEKKIKERTRELELSRDSLLRSLRERDLRMNRICEDIMKAINTIDGLCAAASLELTDPIAGLYTSKIKKTCRQVSWCVRVMSHKDSSR